MCDISKIELELNRNICNRKIYIACIQYHSLLIIMKCISIANGLDTIIQSYYMLQDYFLESISLFVFFYFPFIRWAMKPLTAIKNYIAYFINITWYATDLLSLQKTQFYRQNDKHLWYTSDVEQFEKLSFFCKKFYLMVNRMNYKFYLIWIPLEMLRYENFYWLVYILYN